MNIHARIRQAGRGLADHSGWRDRARIAWSRFTCTRPMLALHVLRGRPVVYRAHFVTGPAVVNFGDRSHNARIVGCLVDGDAG